MMPHVSTLKNAYRSRKGDGDFDASEQHVVPHSFAFMVREGGLVKKQCPLACRYAGTGTRIGP